MRRGLVYGGAAVSLGAALFWLRREGLPSADEAVRELQPPPEAAPMCPWREPEADLQRFFPGATGYQTETLILSSRYAELSGALGRRPSPDELSLRLHRIRREDALLGTILTRRVKGESGAIEFVLALDRGGTVRGLRLQRLREPEEVAGALLRPAWLGSFAGKTAANRWRLGEDLPAVDPRAIGSAQAIVEGVRSLLILLAVAENTAQPPSAPSHH